MFDPNPYSVDQHLGGDTQSALDLALAMVSGYTRGVGFDEHGYLQVDSTGRPVYLDLAAVVTTVAGRLKTNPSGLRVATSVGGVHHDVAGWSGFTTAEQIIMNRYRKRAM